MCIIMEVDTGATVSIMSETTFQSLWPGRRLDCTEVRLQSYSKETILEWAVATEVKVGHEKQTPQLPLIVVKGTVQLYWAGIGC